MPQIIPHTIWQVNPIRNDESFTFNNLNFGQGEMNVTSSRQLLWSAVLALMTKRYGAENLNRLAREVKISPASASRLKAQETSVGLDLVDKLAEAFKIEPWHLLIPGFNPEHPPTLQTISPMARDVAEMLDSIQDEEKRRRAYALIVQIVEFGAGPVQEQALLPAPEPTQKPANHS